ncbi:MAG: methyltransferase domain-containing protein [Myxococcales bacterium]|nr:methyltransferase domain-containing protein [Myxococcales bacterium]
MTLGLHERIQKLYDQTTQGWVHVWGEHLHHGYYVPQKSTAQNHQQAQVDMISALINWSGAPKNESIRHILDAGCGVGGSTRWLALHYGAEVDGITLSPVQRSIAEKLSISQPDVRFHVGDANQTPFADESFDMVWSLESGEHMPCKQTFLKECDRVLRPGGHIIMATWCHRPAPPELSPAELRLLSRISHAYQDSLTWVPLSTYETLLDELAYENIQTEDWSSYVTPFWHAVINSMFTLKGVQALAKGGLTMIKGASGGWSMRQGLSQGLVRYTVIAARKQGTSS